MQLTERKLGSAPDDDCGIKGDKGMIATPVTLTIPVPVPSQSIVRARTLTNRATTVLLSVIVTKMGEFPVLSPLKPLKMEPAAALPARLMMSPSSQVRV